jgi:chlorobactene glucosyltransferase
MRSRSEQLWELLAWSAACAYIVRGFDIAALSECDLPVAEPSVDLPALSIIVPARNEERQIETCVRSLLGQRYPDFEVIVVDDCSTDRTQEVLRALGVENLKLRIVRGARLPRGWVGKPWALAQGARVARGSWLLFTDADTVHQPLAAASAVTYARETQTAALSLLTQQEFVTLGERMLLPSVLWIIAFAVGSLRAINDPRRTDAAIFNGQFVLFERRAYEQLGGHAAVADCIAEDYELARLVKRDARFRSRLLPAPELVATRMYRSFAETWNGFSKNLFIAAEDAPLQAIGGITQLLSLSPLPEVLAVRALMRRDWRRAVRMALLVAATAAVTELGMRRFRYPRGSGAFFPFGAPAMAAIFLNSALLHLTGRVSWRGRRY